MANTDLLRKYITDEVGGPRVIIDGCVMPTHNSPAAEYFYTWWEQAREAIARTNPEAAFPNNEKGLLYEFLLILWADVVMGEDIQTVELVETEPMSPVSKPQVVINGEHIIPALTDDDEVVPEIVTCLQAALHATPLPYPSQTTEEAYTISGGTMFVIRGDTCYGGDKPVRVVLERAS